jgi:hypothetical protein
VIIGYEHVVGVNIGQEHLLDVEPLETGGRNVGKYLVVATKILRRT